MSNRKVRTWRKWIGRQVFLAAFWCVDRLGVVVDVTPDFGGEWVTIDYRDFRIVEWWE